MAGSLDNAQKLTQENDEIESLIIYLDNNDDLKIIDSNICYGGYDDQNKRRHNEH